MRLSTKLSLVFLPAVLMVLIGLLLVAADALDEAILVARHDQLTALLQQLRQAELLRDGQVDAAAVAEQAARLGIGPQPSGAGRTYVDPGSPEGALLVAWQDIMLHSQRHLTVLQADGRLLLSTMPGGYDYEAFWRAELATAAPPAAAADHVRAGIAALPGQSVPYAAGRHPALGWMLVVAVPQGEMAAALASLDWWILGVGGALSLGLLVLGWVLARRLILQPVAVLQGAARDIAAFRPVGRIPIQGRDELAELARSLEVMAKDLATAFAALKRQHAMNAVLMNAAPAAVAILDAQGRILYGNGRFTQAFGPAAGRAIADAVASAAQHAAATGHFAAAQPAAREFQLPGGPDSAVFAWTVAALPTVLPEGALEGSGAPLTAHASAAFVATGVDVTAHRRAEAARQALQTQAEHQQRLETLGTFAGGVAHDLNNILTPVLGYARMAEDRVLDPETADYLRRIGKSADRARHLIQQILTFGRKVGPELEILDLAEIVAESLDLELEQPAEHAGRAIAVRRDLPDSPGAMRPLVKADAVQLHQVLSNLVSNARHAMPDGGELGVTVTVETAAVADGGVPVPWAVVRVSDTGAGMDGAVLARIFEPFFTTRRTGHGTGLGLSVVHGIVTAHGGRIEVRSRPGAGSRFTVYLPLVNAADAPTPSVAAAPPEPPADAAPAAVDPAPATGISPPAAMPAQVRPSPAKPIRPQPADPARDAAQPARPALTGTTILVVDDDAAVQLLTQRVLQTAGCNVVSMSSAAKALDWVKRAAGRPGGTGLDLALTDLVMPEMTGQDLAAAIARLDPDLPLVAMTGGPGALAGSAGDDQAALFVARLSKPFTPDELQAVVRRVLASGRNRS